MGSLSADILPINDILSKVLYIPDYQRPYKWTEKNVLSLLEDIYSSWRSKKSSYRIGSLIIYQKDKKAKEEIVDGQQRITTILLLLNALEESNIGQKLINSLEYNHKISQWNIVHNDRFIRKWIIENIHNDKNELKDFHNYLINKCEFVKIVVGDISEAFQMFDSQNSRGRALEAYNLLKAYHIRAMEMDDETLKISADKRWENAARYHIEGKKVTKDILKQIFNEQIYRTRLWSRKEEALRFGKQKIDEFKGITIGENHSTFYPYQNMFLLEYWANEYLESKNIEIHGLRKRFKNEQVESINPFVQINQNLVNGRPFFEYIETYVEIYKQLFVVENQNLLEFKKFFRNYCEYTGHKRTGDGYLREAYKSAIFLLFDKYGEEITNKYYKTIYSLIYRYRLEKMQVRYKTISKSELIFKLFSVIENSKNEFDLLVLSKNTEQKIDIYFNEKAIVKFFEEYQKEIQLSFKDKSSRVKNESK